MLKQSDPDLSEFGTGWVDIKTQNMPFYGTLLEQWT